VPAAVNWAAATTYMSVRRLKRSEKTDVGFATWSQRQWAEVVDADGDTCAIA